MILIVDISAATLCAQGISFVWKKPDGCPKCPATLWGHGHVFSNGLFLKRYRCPTCKTVVTLKPPGFWRGYRTAISEIYARLRHRVTAHRPLLPSRRQCENHWLKKFVTFLLMLYGGHEASSLPLGERLDIFFAKEIAFLS